MTSTKQGTLSRGDAGALIGFCIAGVAIAAYITVFSVIRIITLLSGTMIPVMVEFMDQPIEALSARTGRTSPSNSTGRASRSPRCPRSRSERASSDRSLRSSRSWW